MKRGRKDNPIKVRIVKELKDFYNVGRRTVSYQDIAMASGLLSSKDGMTDLEWAAVQVKALRIVSHWVPRAQRSLERDAQIFSCPVSAYCVMEHAEKVVDKTLEARKCIGGFGRAANGVRFDKEAKDLVYREWNAANLRNGAGKGEKATDRFAHQVAHKTISPDGVKQEFIRAKIAAPKLTAVVKDHRKIIQLAGVAKKLQAAMSKSAVVRRG